MNSVRAANLVALLSIAVMAIRIATLGPHSDDIGIFAEVHRLGYPELFGSPFFGFFYRPLVIFAIDVADGFFGDPVAAIRALEAILLVANALLAKRIFDANLAPLPATIALVCLVGSPFTFVTVAPFAVGIADLLVGLAFLRAVEISMHSVESRRQSLELLLLSMLAILSKESGLLVGLYSLLTMARRRAYAPSFALVLFALGFVYFRSKLVSSVLFPFDSGLGLRFLDTSELRARFGESPLPFYAYSVVASLLSVFTSEPNLGYFEPAYRDLFTVSLMLGTTLVIIRFLLKERASFHSLPPLVLVVFANAFFGHAYVRPRIMFVAYFAISVLVGFALDRVLRSDEKPFGLDKAALANALLLGWTVMLIASSVRVAML